ncbi:hypothetical protein F5X96DRAFT_631564 [Biscogniauxia mediterranea]|nr:hypothetical protein F5X96DRAFT_631564 [Biscogniauxia mediterranea]
MGRGKFSLRTKMYSLNSASPVDHSDIFPIQVNARIRTRPYRAMQSSQDVEDLKAHVQSQIVPSFSEIYKITPIFISFVPLNASQDITFSGSFLNVEAPADLESGIRRGEPDIKKAIIDGILPVEWVSRAPSAIHCWIDGGERPDFDKSSHRAPLPKDPMQSMIHNILPLVEGLPLIRERVNRIKDISQGKKEASADVERLKKASKASERVLKKWKNMTSDDNHALLSKTEDSLELIQQTMELVQERRRLEATMNQVMPLWDEEYSHKNVWTRAIVTALTTIASAPLGGPFLLTYRLSTSVFTFWNLWRKRDKIAMGESVRETQKDSISSGEQLRGLLALHFLHQEGLTTSLGAEDKRMIFEYLQIQPDMIEDNTYKEGFIKTALEELLHFNQKYIEAVEKLLAS